METFNWTGNIRELRNLIERAVLLGSGTVLTLKQLGFENGSDTKTLPPSSKNSPGLPPLSPIGIDLPALIQSIEKAYFEQALKISSGNTSKAARLLNMSRDKFRYRLQKE